MIHILHQPRAAATYYLKGALCELFDFLSSGFYVTPVHLSSSPESLLFLRISRLLEDTDGRLPRSDPQAAMSRHRGAKPPRRCGLLGEISLLSPG